MSAFDPLRTFTPSEMLSTMTDLDRQWSLSNPGPNNLLVWLEPWAEEFEVPVGSTITLRASGQANDPILEETEWTPDYLVLWASAPGTVKVFIDEALQESASAVVDIPEGMTKKMLNIVFAGQPAARLAGRSSDVAEQTSWWRRLRRRLGL
jgi:hypothetical protein